MPQIRQSGETGWGEDLPSSYSLPRAQSTLSGEEGSGVGQLRPRTARDLAKGLHPVTARGTQTVHASLRLSR